MISLGGTIGGIRPASSLAGNFLRFAGDGEIRAPFPATEAFLVMGEAGCRPLPGTVRVPLGCAAASGCGCTGGRGTGFPDRAARVVGLTLG